MNPGGGTFCLYYPVDPEEEGFKIHVTAHPDDAEVVARTVLPRLRAMRVPHKVVRDRSTYLRIHGGDQRGKFITIYPGASGQAQLVVDQFDPALANLRLSGGLRPGPVPHARRSGHTLPEIRVGRSGLVFTIYSDDYRA
jgi:hypothetical protein